MSWMPDNDPTSAAPPDQVVDLTIEPRARDLGGFTVGRVLPAPKRRMVGPFVFLDHMGPATFAPGAGMDVRPHPHINLATITYLYEGAILHRDSLGSEQVILPDDVNWMSAGRGITHSERTPADVRVSRATVHGLQAWVALPTDAEESEPTFQHHKGATLPSLNQDGVELRLIAGSGFGLTSPVSVYGKLVYADAKLAAGAVLEFSTEHKERAVYVVDGAVQIAGHPERLEGPQMAVFAEGAKVSLCAERDSRVMLLGGDPVGPRFIEWNFVSSTQERIEVAKKQWRERQFPLVPGDETEFIPLP